MTTTIQRGSFFAKAIFVFIALVFLPNFKLVAQANSIKTGVTFNWANAQTSDNNPATIKSIDINGSDYNRSVASDNHYLIQDLPIYILAFNHFYIQLTHKDHGAF